jgi:ABC-type polar amino acid transport system ATPase subunit
MNERSNHQAVAVTALSKRYGDQVVLRNISLTVRRGEVCAILGPSGGGKTTFLRCLNGLETFQEGRVELAGVTLFAELPPRERNAAVESIRRRVGMVFQQFNLFPHRSALGNVIEAPIHVLGRPRDQATEQARELLARVGMADKMHAMPDTLSGGQQQRVAIARALAMQPEVILFDEPTSALDPRMAGEVESVMADLAAGEQTMVVVTHSLRLARRTAHTVHVFEQGRVLESGPSEQIFREPRQDATRRFLSEAGER